MCGDGRHDLPGRLDAVEPGHPEVHQDDVGLGPRRRGHGAPRRRGPRRPPRPRAPTPSSAHIPARNAGWSSATSTRTTSSLTAPPRSGSRACTRVPPPGASSITQRAAELLGPLAHRAEPDAADHAVRAARGRRRRPPPPAPGRPARGAPGTSPAPACRAALVTASTTMPVGRHLDRGRQRRQRGRARPGRRAGRRPRWRVAAARSAPTRPRASSAGGRSASTTRRTSATASCATCTRSASTSAARAGSGPHQVAGRLGLHGQPRQLRSEPVVQVAPQPAPLLLARRHEPLPGALQVARQPAAPRRARPRARPRRAWRARSPSSRRSAAATPDSPARAAQHEPPHGLAAVGQRHRSGSTAGTPVGRDRHRPRRPVDLERDVGQLERLGHRRDGGGQHLGRGRASPRAAARAGSARRTGRRARRTSGG